MRNSGCKFEASLFCMTFCDLTNSRMLISNVTIVFSNDNLKTPNNELLVLNLKFILL